MAELADALDSGSSESNFMEVQVLLPAPNKNLVVDTITRFLFFIFGYIKVLIYQGVSIPFVKKCCFERSNSTVG